MLGPKPKKQKKSKLETCDFIYVDLLATRGHSVGGVGAGVIFSIFSSIFAS